MRKFVLEGYDSSGEGQRVTVTARDRFHALRFMRGFFGPRGRFEIVEDVPVGVPGVRGPQAPGSGAQALLNRHAQTGR